jgi:hypothetical protein
MSTIVDHEGKLAVDFGGWQKRQDEPVEDRLLRVSDIPVEGWDRLIGQSVDFFDNNARCYNPATGRTIFFTTEKWERVLLERPVKKPRRGKDYDWEWAYGQWRKTWL